MENMTTTRMRMPKLIADSLTRVFTRRYSSNKYADVADIPAYAVNQFDRDVVLEEKLPTYLPDYMAPAGRM